MTAVDAGRRRRSTAALGGIGGCPFAPTATGNIATEDLAYALRRSGVHFGLDLGKLVGAAAFIGKELDMTLPALLGRAGDFPGSLSPERAYASGAAA